MNASLEDLFLMAQNQNFVPVTDDLGSFIGIVTRRDILQYYYKPTHPEIAQKQENAAAANAEGYKTGDFTKECIPARRARHTA